MYPRIWLMKYYIHVITFQQWDTKEWSELILRVKEKFYWFSMSQATKNFVRTCDVCSKFKNANRKVRCPMSKMERVHLDFLGPLPESTSGNTNILVMVDQFTKCPYQAKQPKWRQEQRWMNFVCTFWFPVMWSAPNSQKSHTPYRSSANGQVVRFNRTITDAVRYFVGKSQDNWDEHLPQLVGAINSSVNRNTSFTPNKLMLGREVTLPADLVFRPLNTDENKGIDDYVTRLQKIYSLITRGGQKCFKDFPS